MTDAQEIASILTGMTHRELMTFAKAVDAAFYRCDLLETAERLLEVADRIIKELE